MKATTKLRKLLKAPGIIILPAAYDCIGARIIESEGFPAVYMTGGGTAASRTGSPDVGLITMYEMVDNARRMAMAVEIPVICDCDTGYGNPINVVRTVREFELAGVAAIQIEDQIWPKKCGHFEGKQVIGMDEMVQKVRAAVDTRKDKDLVIIARTDAIAVTGFEDAIKRGLAYQEAGADMLFFEAPGDMNQIETVGRTFKTPLIFNMATSGKTPLIPAKEMEKLGYKIALYAGTTMYVFTKIMKEFLRTLKETGSWEAFKDRMVPFREFWDMMGVKDIEEMEKRYRIV